MSGLPRLFLSTRAMLRVNPSNRNQSAALDDAPEAEGVFDLAAENGISAILTTGEAPLMRLLRLAHRRYGTGIYPIIPNMPSYLQDVRSYGLVGAGVRRLRHLGPLNLVRLGCYGATKALSVLDRDFNTMMSILFEMEMAEFRRLSPPAVFLDGQITDLCLAFGNKELLVRFAQTIDDRYHAQPGLVTNNLGTLIPRLKQWNIPIQLLIAPFNLQGFAMKPDRVTCESLLDERKFMLIADRICVGAKPCADTYHYLREHGISSAVLDVTDKADLELAINTFQQKQM